MKSPDPGQPRYTIMVVPEAGQGAVRQYTLTRRHFRLALLIAIATVAVVLVGTIVAARTLPGAAVYAENQALKAQLSALERSVVEAEAELERFQLQRARLKSVLPEYGPLDDEEVWVWLHGEDAERPKGLLNRTQSLIDGLRDEQSEMEALIAGELERRDRTPNIWPVDGWLTSGFKWRISPIDGRLLFHQGLDIAAPLGSPVVATAGGVVTRSAYSGGYGNLVEIDHGNGIRTRYAHNAELLVSVGEQVQRGDVIAAVGSTGRSTGPHVHYEVRIDGKPVDPIEYVEE